MKALCKKETSEDGRLPSCPRAMTVFAIGNELYFSSSVKGKGLSRNNEFMTTLLLDSNFKDAEVSRVDAADRLQTSMLRCQARQRTVVDPVEHHHNARCGEFPSVFLYLAGQDDPETIDLSQGRIMTVGDGQAGARWPPIYRPCPPTLQDSVQKYGCQDWIQQFGITRVLNGGDPQFANDPQQKTEHIPPCGLNPQ